MTKPPENPGTANSPERRTAAESPDRGTVGAADPLVKALRGMRDKAKEYLPEDFLE